MVRSLLSQSDGLLEGHSSFIDSPAQHPALADSSSTCSKLITDPDCVNRDANAANSDSGGGGGVDVDEEEWNPKLIPRSIKISLKQSSLEVLEKSK